MILLEIELDNKDHLRKLMNLISNYNKLNDDKIKVKKIYEIIENKKSEKNGSEQQN